MPYTTENAPPRKKLPKSALSIWVEVFNSTLKDTGDETKARKAAWGAVKKAGFRKGQDGRWSKVGAADSAILAVEGLRVLDRAAALALPSATPSKVYAEFRLLCFGKPNENKDGFRSEDISDAVIAGLVGSPIYLDDDLDDHPEKDGRSTTRARFQGGAVISAEKREDGLYCIGAFQRETLEDRKVVPSRLIDYSVSMEVMFDRTKARYHSAGQTYDYPAAVEAGIASPIGSLDDRSKYEVRYIPPIEFHAVAMLIRGRNADKGADMLRVAAAQTEEDVENLIPWSDSDFALYEAFWAEELGKETAAELTSKSRKKLRKSQFAYVDEDGEGHLPIQDAAHVKNALARLNQTDIPDAAKKSALAKIRRAAKKHGVKIDADSPVMKRYGGDESYEDQATDVREAFHKAFSPQSMSYAYPVKTFADHIIFERDGNYFRADYTRDGDSISFGDAVEVEVEYRPKKKDKEASSMAQQDDKTKVGDPTDGDKDKVYTQADLDSAVKEAVEKAVSEKSDEIGKAAVEAYKAREKTFADRMKELDEVLSVKDDEKAELEGKVRESDDAAYGALKMSRMEAAIKALREGKAAASKEPDTVFNGLRPAPKEQTETKDPFRVDLRK